MAQTPTYQIQPQSNILLYPQNYIINMNLIIYEYSLPLINLILFIIKIYNPIKIELFF
jgi:hypothetical protein